MNPNEIFQTLGAFWQHFGIHKRKSDYSGKDIISVFSQKCPYPVWHYEEWKEYSNPPNALYNNEKDFWEQVWELFSQCPIPHNIGFGNQNSQYTDDCWYSKNCYLCHSILNCEDTRYSYRIVNLKDCYFCVFSFDSQKCLDLMYSFNCYHVKFGMYLKRCRESSFLFDCEDCENCLLCRNLRNKKYCIGNKQYTKEGYEQERRKYNFTSRTVYESLKKEFSDYIKKNAWWEANRFDSIEASTGDYLAHCKNCENCYYMQESEDCINGARAIGVKSSTYFVSVMQSERVYLSVLAQENCFDISFCANVTRCKNMLYSMNCLDCENCFLCNGLVGKQYHVLNKEYSAEEFKKIKEEILLDMKQKEIYETFFPFYFAPSSYEESLAGIYYPLSSVDQSKEGFRVMTENYGDSKNYKNRLSLPDNTKDIGVDIVNTGFWDEVAQRPFQILKDDIEFYTDIGGPIHDTFYIRRLKENFSWMYPSFNLRKTKCAKTGKEITTTLPASLDERILSNEEYKKTVY